MTPRPTALLLLAAALALAPAPALAQGAAEPASKADAAKTSRAKKKSARKVAPAAAAPTTRSPILGSGGEDEAASLERRRKAFFAKQPDAGGPDQPEAPSAGVTLGGSGGITPGMGFKF